VTEIRGFPCIPSASTLEAHTLHTINGQRQIPRRLAEIAVEEMEA
jgi:hypothetical protein